MPTSMPIDLASVDWLYVVVLAMFVFVATIIGSLLSFSHRLNRCRVVGGDFFRALCALDLLSAQRAVPSEDAHAR